MASSEYAASSEQDENDCFGRSPLAGVPTLIKGLRIVGLAGLNTGNLMPADFLIDEHGSLVEAYYGGDAGDRIPIERIELFLARGLMSRASARVQASAGLAAGA